MVPARSRPVTLVALAAVLAGTAAAVAWHVLRDRPAGLEGVVTLDGKPVGGATIVIDPLRPWEPQDASIQTDAAGRFFVAAAPWEWCRVAAVSGDRYAVVLLGPNRRGDLDLELRPPGALEVEVVGEGGSPLSSPQVRLIEPIDERSAAERVLFATSADQLDQRPDPGAELEQLTPTAFRAAGLYPGRYFVWVRAAGFADTFFPVSVAPDSTSRHRFVLPRLTRAAGKVTDTGGEQLANVVIELTPRPARPEDPADALMAALRDEGFALLGPDPKPVTATTDERGAFDVELGPGTYSVVVVQGDDRLVSPDFTAPAPVLTLVARRAGR